MPERAQPWWQTGVLYQVYPRSFQDSDGDGVGDLDGITSRLDYLVDLGVDVVWISPFYPSPLADGGYDVADYCDVHPELGTLASFDRLVARAHRLGLRVVIDWVPNHSSDQHPWFRSSRDRSSPHRDWYVWRDARPGTGPGTGRPPAPPTNWLSAFGGPAWTWDEVSGQFYLHSFLPQQPDLDWRCPALRHAMLDTLRFWMDRGVDGFRVDVAHHIAKDPQFRDNPPEPHPNAGHKPVADYDRQQHVHDRAHAYVHELFRAFRRLVDSHGPEPCPLFGEIHLGHDLAQWASYFGRDDELHLPLNFGLLGAPWTAEGVREHVGAVEAAVPPGAWPSYVLGSHDERRLASRLGPAGARLAAVLMLTLRGTPTLYQGDEIGIPQVDVPPDRGRDPAGVRTGVPGLGRDGGRTPMAWNAEPGAGFSTAPPASWWLPLHPSHGEVNVHSQQSESGSLLNLYRRLLSLRRATPGLRSGSYQPCGGLPATVVGYVRESSGSRALVVLNLGAETVSISLPAGRWQLGASTHQRHGRDGGETALAPSEGAVFIDPQGVGTE